MNYINNSKQPCIKNHINWDEYLHKKLNNDRHADEVLPNIWVGRIESLTDCSIMNQITAVVSVVHPSRINFDLLKKLIGNRDYLLIPIWDHPNEPIELYFDEVADFIHDHIINGHTVLVNCVEGHSRSVSFVIYYMLKYMNYKTVTEALSKIRKTRPLANPNKGFIKKLIMFNPV